MNVRERDEERLRRSSGRIPASPPARLPKVLAVEGAPELLGVYERALQPEFTVTTCPDSAEALKLLAAGERFDVVICDVRGRLRSDGFYEQAVCIWHEIAGAILVVGGGRSVEEQERLVGTPMLTKPFDASQLIAAVRARASHRQRYSPP
jgi:two-component system, NtrC family, sensor kinase